MSNPHSAEVKEPTFEGLSIKDGLMEMKIGNAEHFIKGVGLSMVDILESVEATNYVSFEISKSKLGPLELILQKTNGKTAHTLRMEAESEKQRLQTLLDESRKIIEFYSVRKLICSHDDSSWCNEFCYDSGDMAREFLGSVS